MGREVRRVPLDFDWEIGKVWDGFLLPKSLHEDSCPDCESGYSERGEYLHKLWYGNVPFRPEDNGSTPFTVDTPAVRAFAERNVSRSPEFYGIGTGPDLTGRGDAAVLREAHRLADHWNSGWGHHLNQDDVDALVAAGRLMDFTHTCKPGEGWKPIEPTPRPTAAEVNEWSLRGFGHDSLNAHVAIEARCAREGVPATCPTCDGHATVEAYTGQRADAEAWEPTPPPTGDGYQLWSTTTKGHPVSPVFDTPVGLARWMTTKAEGWSRASSVEAALRFINAGWAPSMVVSAAGVQPGVEVMGARREA
ncbi:hypothetical protein Q8791_22985 [Nocardiopsis sp. CT-R113]|uniref:Uncharacterized protein n=1 Tax=Nocardiopsis codii TaxID=3065942 RepID=A0ABU7KCX8_9ACTN|nr:hypothetical protein [Nocardiopsis sp. CT-R113]MEE2040086.1 hypothetical protein [Nocardiopsis sp. CT-R113]